VWDAINLEKQGVAAVAVVHDVFEKAARAQAIALGMPDLRMVVYPQPKLSDVESSAPGSARQVVDSLAVMAGL
jgi:hypothetical protein|tara:strand:+ start:145 stop:363 length:219 start_codon:yes stop_codon:yes gene_type:complete